jgi:hypothetical protein
MSDHLTLKDAIRLNRLEDFIRQQEAQGVQIPAGDLEAALERAIKQQPAEDQTSPDPSRGGSA